MRCKFPVIVVKDLVGNDFSYGDINKTLGGSIYMMAPNVRLQEIGRALYDNGEAEINADDVQMLIPVINEFNIPIILKNKIIHYLTTDSHDDKDQQNK